MIYSLISFLLGTCLRVMINNAGIKKLGRSPLSSDYTLNMYAPTNSGIWHRKISMLNLNFVQHFLFLKLLMVKVLNFKIYL